MNRALARRIDDAESVVQYLTEIGLLRHSGGRPRVADLSSRNRVFSVETGSARYVVKQAAFAEDRREIVNEAWVLRHLGDVRHVGSPRVRGFDVDAAILVVDAIGDAPLISLLDEVGGLPESAAVALGRALAHVHRAPAPDGGPPEPPGILSLHRPAPDDLRHLSAANTMLLMTLQRAEGLCRELDRLRDEWRPSAMTHNDVRWENCVVDTVNSQREIARLRLVDWERSGAGDCRVDLGAVAGELLLRWLDSMEVDRDMDACRAAVSAKLSRTAIAQSASDFWRAYEHERRLGDRARALVVDAMRFSAARVVEGAFERTADRDRLDRRSILALQLAANLLKAPRAAARALLGLASDAA